MFSFLDIFTIYLILSFIILHVLNLRITMVPLRSFLNLSQKYGDIFSIFVGTKPVVVLNSWALISEGEGSRPRQLDPIYFCAIHKFTENRYPAMSS